MQELVSLKAMIIEKPIGGQGNARQSSFPLFSSSYRELIFLHQSSTIVEFNLFVILAHYH